MHENHYNITSTYLRLRSNASIETLTVDNTFWQKLSSGKLGDFHNEYLVSCHSFDSDWSVWEMHPNGDEVVCLLTGDVTFVLELEGGDQKIRLTENGAYTIVPKGTWHKAKINTLSRMLFITAGEGTQHRQAI